MVNFLRSLGNLYLYSSLNISLCAALFTIESYLTIGHSIKTNYVAFIFFSTISAYSLHRVIGISKVGNYNKSGRYEVIQSFRSHILIYFIFSGLIAFYYLMKLSLTEQLLLIAPILVTAMYMLPIFKDKKRLRDFSFVKIFLIAFTWAWVAYFIPLFIEPNYEVNMFLLAERVIFVFAITIPFDIRDVEVDQSLKVPTLVHKLGIKKSKLLGFLMLLINTGILLYLLRQNLVSDSYALSLILIYILSGMLIDGAEKELGDWYFGGFIDALLGLRILVFITLTSFLN